MAPETVTGIINLVTVSMLRANRLGHVNRCIGLVISLRDLLAKVPSILIPCARMQCDQNNGLVLFVGTGGSSSRTQAEGSSHGAEADSNGRGAGEKHNYGPSLHDSQPRRLLRIRSSLLVL